MEKETENYVEQITFIYWCHFLFQTFSDAIKKEQKEDQVSAADDALRGNDSVHNDSSSDGAFSISLVFRPFDDLHSYLDRWIIFKTNTNGILEV